MLCEVKSFLKIKRDGRLEDEITVVYRLSL